MPSKRVEAAIYAERSRETLKSLVASMSSEELHEFACMYNWDDGSEPMRWVSDRADCDLGTALQIFWLAGPDLLWERRDLDEGLHSEVLGLLEELQNRILSGHYSRHEISFDATESMIPNRLQAERLRRNGVPEALLFAVARGHSGAPPNNKLQQTGGGPPAAE